MKLPPFEYACPTTINEAVALLANHDGEAKPLAGGQSLMPMMAFRIAQPSLLVDLRKLPGLKDIKIGPRRRPSRRASAVARRARRQAACHGASASQGGDLARCALPDPQPRHCRRFLRACRSGLGDARHCADLRRPNHRDGQGGTRASRRPTFFPGALTTALKSDEIITEIHLPAWPAAPLGVQEFARRRGDFAMAGVALYDVDGGKARNAHVGAIGVADRPMRLPAVEQVAERQHGRRGHHRARRRPRHPRRSIPPTTFTPAAPTARR